MMVIKKYENGVRYKAELLPTSFATQHLSPGVYTIVFRWPEGFGLNPDEQWAFLYKKNRRVFDCNDVYAQAHFEITPLPKRKR